MNSNKLTIASIFTCIFAVTACAGDMETGEVTLTDLEGSTYQQALTPDGDVDCDRLHSALEDHGIDPTMLDPDVVLEACVDSGDVSDLQCQRVAYTCFGPNACDGGHPGTDPTPPDDDWCDAVFDAAAQSGIDADGLGGDEAFEACIDAGFEAELCARVEQCFADPDGHTPSPDTDMCELAREQAEQLGIDLADLSDEEAYELCADAGFDDQLCWELVEQCLGADGGPDGDGADGSDQDGNPGDADGSTDPSTIDCAEVERLLHENGIETPVDEAESQMLYEECVQQFNNEALCQAALQCVI